MVNLAIVYFIDYCQKDLQSMDIALHIRQLETLLPQVETRQHFYLMRDLRQLKRQKAVDAVALTALSDKIHASIAKCATRAVQFPLRAYNEGLPIVGAREEICAAINNHQVTVICGETGSGKTTQLAKMCLDLGLGKRGLIGHTQPRRIAARTVATRIAEELASPLGHFVGYKMRFADQTHNDTVIKLMTDGILLTELSKDRFLSQYEVIIIDEAHERSLNIDFLLGILKKLLPKRPDLKIIITSATIDPERFANYFKCSTQAVPIIEVSGRTFPVELRYRPLNQEVESEGLSINEGVVNAVHELAMEAPGDILVFLSGEREIRELAEILHKEFQRFYEVLPLFSRLSQGEQNRIFAPHQKLRIVLATNVAETSLTVPGIKYVIDSGVARISRYNPRSRLQRLLVEPIAQASANQRSGRCGRVSAGVCIRLFSAEDFNQRPEFLDPEILRTHLAAVILQMSHLRLGDPSAFPFIEAPEARQIKEGYQTLKELKAINEANELTGLGKRLANMPLDPRFGAMLFEGARTGVGHELIVLVSLLSIQNPNERPLDKQQAADEKHRLFKDKTSDFMGYLNLWSWYQTQAKTHSQAQMRQLCRRHFISYMRMREWYELYGQISQILTSLKVERNAFPKLKLEDEEAKDLAAYRFPSFAHDQIHQALLVGLLDQVGALGEEGFYVGGMGQKFRIFPGSTVFKKPPKWVVAMEIVETSQVYARTCAAIDPLWLESLGANLIKKQYSEPHWSKKQGQACAYETVLLFNLAIVRQRLVAFGQIDSALSRELMIKEGLIAGDINIYANFYRHNVATREVVERMEDKTRRRDILIEEWKLYEWYAARIPSHCYSVKHLEQWCKDKANNATLIFTQADLLANDDALNLEDFPEVIHFNELTLNALYLFDPAHEDDGMTVLVPLAALNLLDKTRLEWLAKGLLKEKVTALMRSLPKSVRRNFVPLPEYADKMVAGLNFAEGHLTYQLSALLSKASGLTIEPHEFNEAALEKHLRMNIRIIDSGGKTLAQSRDLTALKTQFTVRAQSAFQALAASDGLKPRGKTPPVKHQIKAALAVEAKEGAAQLPDQSPHSPILAQEGWQIDPVVTFVRNGISLTGYVALVQTDAGLTTKLFDSEAQAQAAHLDTLVALSLQALREEIKYLRRQWPSFGQMALMFRSVGSEAALKEDLMRALVKDHFSAIVLPRSYEALATLIQSMRQTIISEANALSILVIEILTTNTALNQALTALHSSNRVLIEAAIKSQRTALIYEDFISQTDKIWRGHIPRFLKAMIIRIERFSQNIERDNAQQRIISQHRENYIKAAQQLTPQVQSLIEYRWSIEELAVSFFAQPMKTSVPISEKRLNKLWEAIDLCIKNQGH